MNIVIDSTSIAPAPCSTFPFVAGQTTLSQIQILKFKLSKKLCEWVDNQEYNIFYSNFLNYYVNNNTLSQLNIMIINNNIRTFVTLPQVNPHESKKNIVMFINNLDFSDANLHVFCNDILQM